MHLSIRKEYKTLFRLLILTTFFTACHSNEEEQPYLFGLGYGANSASLLVNDLEAAKTYFTDTLGFTIRGAAENGDIIGSKEVSASFPDLFSLDLLALDDSIARDSIPSFITSFLSSNEGVRLYSLSSSSTDSTRNWLVSKGFQLDSIRTFGTSEETDNEWSWDDGGPEGKSLDFNSQYPPAHLPRFIEEMGQNYKQAFDQWRTYYGYGRRYNEHPNGVVGIAAILIAVADLKSAGAEFKKMGFKELEANDKLARFQLVRNQELHLISSINNQEVSDFLARRGEGVYALRFEVVNIDSTYQFLKKELPATALIEHDSLRHLAVLQNYAFGVQLEFVQESEEQALMAKMLRPDDKLDSTGIKHALAMYDKYCALCHGDDRQGYAADNAPSLRSHSLLATSKNTNFLRYTIQYGRANTAMAGYSDTQGGPIEYIDIEILLQWLYETSGVEEPIELSREPVLGNVELGSTIYAKNCAVCHGENGEGITAPALGNPMLLATATDHFLRHAIAEGRDGTPMMAFKDSLSSDEIDAVTAFLRSRASGWDIPEADTVTIPSPEHYVLNPENEIPKFNLREEKYVSAAQVNLALQDSLRMVILDARSEVAWRQMHIPGSVPVPYYKEPENFINDLPKDSTMIVIYCACPHAASQRVMNTLKRNGFENTAIIDEGVLVWAQMGFPVQNGN